MQYQYGAEQDGISGPWREFTLTVKLGANGETNEWTKTYADGAGRTYKTLYATNSAPYPAATSTFDSLGNLISQADPDGVTTLYAYNPKGERIYTAFDMDRSGQIEFNGSDRITYSTNDVATDHGTTVNRTRVYVFNVPGSATSSNLVSLSENSADGLQSWRVVFNNGVGITNATATVYSTNGLRFATNTAPDGSYTLGTYQYGQLLSSSNLSPVLGSLGSTVYQYDAHGRVFTSSDARTGATTNYYNAADQVAATATPIPVAGQSAQFSTNIFDNLGRITATRLSDATWVTNLYTPQGQIQQTYGSRQYPLGYGYDAQGRMTRMTNWANATTGTGPRATTWAYDQYRGWLSGKSYPGPTTNGPAYSYTPGGRLQQRAWARGISTTYTYDTAGGLTNVAYSDGTSTVGYGYDRLGRQTAIANGSNYCNYTYNDAGSVLIEAYTNGPLNGWAITNGYDTLLRRTNLVTLLNGAVQTMTTNNYDAASRLLTISDRTTSATYSFLANSPLVQQIVFANNGTVRMTTTNGYDNLNRLTRISSVPSADAPVTFSYQYNIANQRTAVTNADGSYWLYGYDSLGQVTNGVKYFSTGVPVPSEQFGYAFDQIGNRTGTTAGGDATGSNLRSATYGANSNNQYTNRTVPGAVDIIGVATNSATVTVNNLGTYRNGTFYRAELPITNTSAAVWQSITNLAVLNHGTNADTIGTNTGNIFLPQTPESFTYDLDGNLTQDGRWTYTWDAENRLVGMVSLSNAPTASKMRLTFGYDTKWRRITKTTEVYTGSSWSNILANRFIYDAWNLLDEVNATNNALMRTFLWGLDLSHTMQGAGGVGGLLLITDQDNAGSQQYPAFDANGNLTVLISCSSGFIEANCEYGPFAEVIRTTESAAKWTPFRFSSKYQEDESNLVYYGMRWYSANTGRWLSRDPIAERGGRNLDCFVGNDTVRRVDYLGLESFAASDSYTIYNINKKIPVKAGCIKGDFVIDYVIIDADVSGSFDADFYSSEFASLGLQAATGADTLSTISDKAYVGGGIEYHWVPGKGCCECKSGLLHQIVRSNGTDADDGDYYGYANLDVAGIAIHPLNQIGSWSRRFEVDLICDSKVVDYFLWYSKVSYNPGKIPKTTVTVTIP